jgi:F-type H+-transporting ATPase subunit epsilon
MAESFQLKLVTPTGVVFDGPVNEVIGVGPLGQFGVLAEHINFITSLVPGILQVIEPGGAHEYWIVSGGLAEVREGVMTVLADSADPPAKVNAADASREEQLADAKVSSMSSYDPDYEQAHHDLELARAKVEAANLQQSRH